MPTTEVRETSLANIFLLVRIFSPADLIKGWKELIKTSKKP